MLKRIFRAFHKPIGKVRLGFFLVFLRIRNFLLHVQWGRGDQKWKCQLIVYSRVRSKTQSMFQNISLQQRLAKSAIFSIFQFFTYNFRNIPFRRKILSTEMQGSLSCVFLVFQNVAAIIFDRVIAKKTAEIAKFTYNSRFF